MSERVSDEKKLRLIKAVETMEPASSASLQLERGQQLLALHGEGEPREEETYTSLVESRLPAIVTEEELKQLEWETLMELKRVLAKY